MANVYVRSGAAGAGTGADWANAYTTLAAALTAKAAGDDFWVSDDHAETQGSANTLTAPGTVASPNRIVCVNHSGTVPPISADLRTTATITTTGNFGININGSFYCYGITFSAGSGAVNAQLTLNSAAGNYWQYLKSCKLVKAGTNASTIAINISNGGLNVGFEVTFDNTTMQFGNVSDQVTLQTVKFNWINTPSAIAGATFPTILFGGGSGRGSHIRLEGVDLSALGSGKTLFSGIVSPQVALLKDCKLNASVTISATPAAPGNFEVVSSRSDSAGANYRVTKYRYEGTLTVDAVVIRTGGASDGTTGLAWKIVTTANSKWILPFQALPCAVWNDVTASNVIVTMEGIWNAAVLPNNDEMWFDVEYLGASGNPQGSFASGTKADTLAAGAALTASTQAWDSLATARANSTTYAVGDIRKVTSNSGRLFIVTAQTGTSAASEPGGFASAVDGDAITDGSVTWRTMVRFKQAITLSSPQPGQKGALFVYPKAAKASSTFWIDPKPVLS